MATYKKRGGKKFDKAGHHVHGESTTQEVFDTLDETASKSERWIEKNQKPIFTVLIIIAIAILGYLGYNKYIQQPKEIEASNEMAYPKQYFDKALTTNPANMVTSERDSLLNLGLNGADGKYGFLDIASDYSGTDAGNLANYYAGLSYYKIKNYKNAIKYLSNFSSDDLLLSPEAKGVIGDAFSELNQPKDAFDYYLKAAKISTNSFTTPFYLFKAANTALSLNKNKKATKLFKKIKDNYSNSKEAKNIDFYINKAIYAAKK